MASVIKFEVPVKGRFKGFKFPRALDRRLTELLDKQDFTGKLSSKERKEAEALVEMANTLTILNLSSKPAPRRKSV